MHKDWYPPEPEDPSVIMGIDWASPEGDYTAIMPPQEENILDAAARVVNKDRQGEYDDPVENHVREAIIATATLNKSIDPAEFVKIMHCKKLARSGRGYKLDNVLDKAGYAEIENRVEKAMKDGTVQKIVEKVLGGWVKFLKPKPALANMTLTRMQPTVMGVSLEFAVSGRVSADRIATGKKYLLVEVD